MRDLPVSLVIPAYNESEAIAEVVAQHHEALSRLVREFEIIVVDDGSTDGTATAVPPGQARVLRHPINRGYGQSLQTGIGAARHDWILMTDADGTYPVSEAMRLFDHAPDFDLIIGARQGSHFWGTPLQTILRMIYLFCASFVVGEKLPDANSGLRLARRELVNKFGLVQCLGYSFSTTMTLSLLKEGRFVKFLPIEFRARAGGKSKVKPVRDILRTLQLMTEVILIYNPMKLFVTLAAAQLAACAVFAGLYACAGGLGWLAAAMTAAIGAILSFLFGCVHDSIRMHGRLKA